MVLGFVVFGSPAPGVLQRSPDRGRRRRRHPQVPALRHRRRHRQDAGRRRHGGARDRRLRDRRGRRRGRHRRHRQPERRSRSPPRRSSPSPSIGPPLGPARGRPPVYGDRPTPYETLARLSDELTHDGDRHDLFSSLASAIADGVGASDITLWVGSVDELVPVVSWPPSATAVDGSVVTFGSLGGDGPVHVRPIVHRGTFRGGHADEAAPRRPRPTGGPAAVRPRRPGGRRHRAAASGGRARAAAKRIVAAQDGARRRIERPPRRRPAAAGHARVDPAGRRAPGAGHGDDRRRGRVADGRCQLAEALSELREMARHPSRGADRGRPRGRGELPRRALPRSGADRGRPPEGAFLPTSRPRATSS